MNHFKSIESVSDDWNNLFFWHSVALFQPFIKFTSSCKFHQEINIFMVIKETIKGNNIEMFQGQMNSDLSTDLMHNIFLLCKRFLDCFHSTNEICLFMPDQVYFTKVSLTKKLDLFEVTNVVFLRRNCCFFVNQT